MELDDLIFNINPEWSGLFYSKAINRNLDPGWYNITYPIPRQDISSSLFIDVFLIAKIFKKMIEAVFWILFMVNFIA